MTMICRTPSRGAVECGRSIAVGHRTVMYGGTRMGGRLGNAGDTWVLDAIATASDARRPRWIHFDYDMVHARVISATFMTAGYLA